MCRAPPKIAKERSLDERLGFALYSLKKRASKRRSTGPYVVEILSLFGDEVVCFPVAILLGFLLVSSPMLPFVAEVFGDLGLVSFAEQSLKLFFRRPRPRYAKQSTFYILPGEQFSFPSGHTMRAFYFAASLGSPLWRFYLFDAEPAPLTLALFAFLLAAGTAVARVAKGKHFPSDVLGGAFIGTAIALFAASLGPRHWAALKYPCGVAMTAQAAAVLLMPQHRTQGFIIHVLIAALWCLSVRLGLGPLGIDLYSP